MSRLLLLVAGAAIALAPLAAVGAPSPSPRLDSILATAPNTDYEETTTPDPNASIGPLDAAQFAAAHTSDPAQVRQAQQALEKAGFIAAYGRSWVSLVEGNYLAELVVAFTGSVGAKELLAATKHTDTAEPTYVRDLAVTGIDSYYGAHFHDASNAPLVYGYLFAFVKGNDYFLVTTWSEADDSGRLVSNQTKMQYDLAPAYTISPSEWPQKLPGADAVVTWAIRLGVPLAALIFLILRYRRPRTQLAGASLQLSPDGRFWWDGREWKDTEQGIPPHAQRSVDGNYWWDGTRWRPAPPIRKLF
jgi:hypothetical protein